MPDTKGLGTFVNELHELATDSLDVFSTPSLEVSIIHGKNVTYYPSGPLTDDGNYEFIMTNESNEYTMLDRTTIYGEAEVLKADGTAITAADKISCVNMLPQSLFKQVEVLLNGQSINDLSTSNYPFKSFLENYLTFDTNLKETTLKATEMYIQDTLNFEIDLAAAMAKNTSGIYKRHELITGKKFLFDIVPHVDFLQSKKYLIPGVEMIIRLTKNNDNFGLLHSHAADTYKIKIHKLQLCTRKVILDPRVSAAIEKGLEKSPAIYPVTQSKIKTHLLTAGTQQTYLSQVVRGKLPRSFLFCILDSDRLEAKPGVNPFYFNPCGVNSINVFINSEPVHPIAITPKFSKGEYLKEYRWQCDNSGLKNYLTNGITYEQYGVNSCFFTYDLSPDHCNGYYKHGVETGIIDIHLGFEAALPKNHTLLLFASYDEQVLIDKNRAVTIVS